MTKSWKSFCVLVFFLAFINMVTVDDSFFRSNSAFDASQANGHYYLTHRGKKTEVTETTWRWKRFQANSIWVTHSLAMLAMFCLVTDRLTTELNLGDPLERERKEKQLLASGSPTCTFRCSTRIGTIHIGSALIKIIVYPEGLHIKPSFAPSCPILLPELEIITEEKSFWRKGISIVHTSPNVPGPIFLECSKNHDAVTALFVLDKSRRALKYKNSMSAQLLESPATL